MRKLLILMLAMLMSISTPLAWATNNNVPEIEITWLNTDYTPGAYIAELDWLVLLNYEGDVFTLDRKTGELKEGFGAMNFSEGLSAAANKDVNGDWKYGFINREGGRSNFI